MPDDYDYQERAAILQFDGGLSRTDAEKAAQGIMDAARRDTHDVDRKNDIPLPAAIQSVACAAAADHGDTGDTATRLDTGACHGYLAPSTSAPYAVAAARAGPVYLAAMTELRKTLPNFKP